MNEKARAPRNRTLTLTESEYARLCPKLLRPQSSYSTDELTDKILNADLFEVLDALPDCFVDLLIIDPPYNLSKDFHGLHFARQNDETYLKYLESWFPRLLRLLKPSASVYLCGDWKCSSAEYRIMQKYLKVRNRIIWQREKGRGSLSNWKNNCEDVWFGTISNKYFFDVESVKVRRKVIAPYRQNGRPKDWQECGSGNFRTTYPSNFWDDISVPYWSMPENTDHPTQKPEKLLAKLILASSRPGDMVFDPFLGSGTTAVAAQKLGRKFFGIEINEKYCCWGLARLEKAKEDPSIQGYSDGVFWERNTQKEQAALRRKNSSSTEN